MTSDWLQAGLFVGLLLLLAIPLGSYMSSVFAGERTWLSAALQPLEMAVYRLSGIRPELEMDWRRYTIAFLTINALGVVSLLAIQRIQGMLPLNPEGFGPVDWHSAFNVAVSFATNTNWQNYGGETRMSYLTQMLALTVQNFLSAGCGMALVAALARGFTRGSSALIGNFWQDFTRATIHILLPLSVVLAIALVGQGVVQTLDPSLVIQPLEAPAAAGAPSKIGIGPVASQVAIKQLGTNGGGYFNANSAHPLENPTPLSNLFEMLAILLIPAGLCITFGRLVRDRRQGWMLLSAMLLLFLPSMGALIYFEQQVPPSYPVNGAGAINGASGGNLEGKELRFGVANSAIWAAATTAASNGSVNSMHDSFTPLGGMVTMLQMQVGEVVFGGVGSGLYGMMIFSILTVFLAGLMVGRTPEYLGKKVGPFEMKMVSLAVLLPPATVLLGTAIGVSTEAGLAGILNPGAHGFSEVLYAYSSMGNNNGSAFAGYGADTVLTNLVGAAAMLLSRYGVAIPVIAIAGSLARKKQVPAGPGTLNSSTVLFAVLLASTVILVAALAFLPALALGPIVEHLGMLGG